MGTPPVKLAILSDAAVSVHPPIVMIANTSIRVVVSAIKRSVTGATPTQKLATTATRLCVTAASANKIFPFCFVISALKQPASNAAIFVQAAAAQAAAPARTAQNPSNSANIVPIPSANTTAL